MAKKTFKVGISVRGKILVTGDAASEARAVSYARIDAQRANTGILEDPEVTEDEILVDNVAKGVIEYNGTYNVSDVYEIEVEAEDFDAAIEKALLVAKDEDFGEIEEIEFEAEYAEEA